MRSTVDSADLWLIAVTRPAPTRRTAICSIALNRAFAEWAAPVLSASISWFVSMGSIRRFLEPEAIHAGKCIRVVLLERVPAIEIEHRLVGGKPCCVSLRDTQVEFESEEACAARRQEVLDLRQRHPV